jgi:hypothetical protein
VSPYGTGLNYQVSVPCDISYKYIYCAAVFPKFLKSKATICSLVTWKCTKCLLQINHHSVAQQTDDNPCIFVAM